jgi:uncharacterized SAM-binding protein YcdF (DUF218 family)
MKVFGTFVLIVVLALGGLTVYMLPHDDAVEHTDAVVVLGGAGAERTELGVELADRYDADLVLSSNANFYGRWLGKTCDVDAICFDPSPENTAGEAENIARMADEYGWDHVTVATSSFHTSRSRYLFRQCLGRDRVAVIGTDGDGGGAMDLQLFVRESTGLIAGATVRRAC